MSDLENTADELDRSTQAFIEHLRSMGADFDALSQLSRRNISQTERELILEQYAARQKKELNEKTNKLITENANKLLSFGRALSSAPGSFAPLSTVVDLTTKSLGALVKDIPVFGGIIKGLGEAAGEAAKFMIDSFQQAYGTFERLSDTGVVRTFEDLTTASNGLGLTFSDTEKVLSKASKDLAMIGGSATEGRRIFEQLGVESEVTRRNFQRLGISASEFSEFQVGYIAQQQRYNRGQIKDIRDLGEGTEKYIKELDTLSKLTGVSRKQLQTEQDARLRDVRYRAGVASLDESTREEIDKFLGVMKQTAPQVEEGMKDLIASAGVPTTEAGKTLLLTMQQGGLNVQEVVKKLREGSITGYQAFQQMADAAGKAGNATQGLASIIGDNTVLTKLFVEMRELEAKRSSMTEEQYKKEQKALEDSIKATSGQNAALADTKTAMYNAGRNIEQLATSSEFATKAMNFFAEGTEWVTEKLYEIAGKDLPAHLQARKDERIAIQEYNKALAEAKDKVETNYNEFSDGPIITGTTREEQIALAKEKMENAKRKRISEEEAVGLRQKPLIQQTPEDELKKQFDPILTQLKEDLKTEQARTSLVNTDFLKNKEALAKLESEIKKAEKENDRTKLETLNKDKSALLSEREILEKRLREATEKSDAAAKKFKEKEDEYNKAKLTALATRKTSTEAVKPDNQARPIPKADSVEPLVDTKDPKILKEELAKLHKAQKAIVNDLEEAEKGTEAFKDKVKDWTPARIQSYKDNLVANKKNNEAKIARGQKQLEQMTGGAATAQPSSDKGSPIDPDAELGGGTPPATPDKTQAQTPATPDKKDAQTPAAALPKTSIGAATSAYSRETEQQAAQLAQIREMISSVESNGDYNVVVGGKRENLTNMTIKEVLTLQKKLIKEKNGSAVGKYQVIYKTLSEVFGKVGLGLDSKFDESAQDKIADFLIKRRGYAQYASNPTKESKQRFLSNLAQEWAGLPGGPDNKSYYAGVGNNKAHIKWDDALSKFKNGGIADGPKTGYLAELHGREAVVPLPDGKNIPVNINTDFIEAMIDDMNKGSNTLNNSINSMSTVLSQSNSRIAERIDNLVNIFTTTSAKLTEVVEVLQSSRMIQKNILNSSMNS